MGNARERGQRDQQADKNDTSKELHELNLAKNCPAGRGVRSYPVGFSRHLLPWLIVAASTLATRTAVAGDDTGPLSDSPVASWRDDSSGIGGQPDVSNILDDSSDGRRRNVPMTGELTLGGGVDQTSGDSSSVMAVDARVDHREAGFAIGLGARLRWQDGNFVGHDWNDIRDGLGIVRYLEISRHWNGDDDEVGQARTLAVAAGPLASIDVGSLVESYSAAIETGIVHPGFAMRATGGGRSLTIATDDVTAPNVIAVGGEQALSHAWRALLSVAVDPGQRANTDGTATMMTTVPASTVWQLGARWTAGLRDHGVILPRDVAFTASAVGQGVGAIGVIGAAEFGTTIGTTSWRALVEGRAGVAQAGETTILAPIGPLYLVERERAAAMMSPATLTGSADFTGAAFGFAVTTPTLGTVEARLRMRDDVGTQLWAHTTTGIGDRFRAGAWLAADRTNMALAAEGTFAIDTHWLSRLEVSRLYLREDGALTPTWQAVLWFGTKLGAAQ